MSLVMLSLTAHYCKINFASPDVALFDTTAEEIAKQVSQPKDLNKSTQLRRFMMR